MEVHEPKSVHTWRELFSEIGIIVVGVLIALSAEQLVDTVRWNHKVAEAESAMRGELGKDLAFASGQVAMKGCVAKYLDRLEAAVRNRSPEQLGRLAAMDSPFSDRLGTRPWLVDSWTAAISSEIPNHIPREKLSAYALAFRMITTQRERQFVMIDDYADVVGARLLPNLTPEIGYAQMAALDKLKSNHDLMVRISTAFLETLARQLAIEPDPQVMAAQADDPVRCEKQLSAIAR